MKHTLALAAGLSGLLCVPGFAVAQAPSPAAAVVERSPGVFPGDARIAFVDLGRVAALSKEGQSLFARIDGLRAQKETELQARGKEVAELESKLSQSAAVMNDTAREQLRKQFERAQIDFQRFTQDAQTEMTQVQRELEQAFMEKAFPAIGAVAQERSLWAVFNVADAGVLWREPALDISEEIARRMDGQ